MKHKVIIGMMVISLAAVLTGCMGRSDKTNDGTTNNLQEEQDGMGLDDGTNANGTNTNENGTNTNDANMNTTGGDMSKNDNGDGTTNSGVNNNIANEGTTGASGTDHDGDNKSGVENDSTMNTPAPDGGMDNSINNGADERSRIGNVTENIGDGVGSVIDGAGRALEDVGEGVGNAVRDITR